MIYPHISHISDVLPFVENDPAFAVKSKDCGNTYINYLHMGNDVFPPVVSDAEFAQAEGDAYHHHCLSKQDQFARIRRECRGIAFDTATGVLTSRPFHKFFNAGEREEVALDVLPFDRQHLIMDKMDGSMIRPIYVDGEVRWGTKMGLTDVAALAEDFVARSDINYEWFAEECRSQGLTPIFEFVSRRNRIVVDYADDRMVLLAIRKNLIGTYCSRTSMECFGDEFGIPLVDVYASGSIDTSGLEGWDTTTSTGSAEQFVQSIRQSNVIDEGVVISWGEFGDLMVKIKTEDYTRLHAAKDKMATERRLLEVILDDSVDDLLPILPEDERVRLAQYVEDFWDYFNELAADIDNHYRMTRETCETKKNFALSQIAKDYPQVRPWVFALWDGKVEGAGDAAMKVIVNGLSSETKWQETKSQWNIPLNWNEVETDE